MSPSIRFDRRTRAEFARQPLAEPAGAYVVCFKCKQHDVQLIDCLDRGGRLIGFRAVCGCGNRASFGRGERRSPAEPRLRQAEVES